MSLMYLAPENPPLFETSLLGNPIVISARINSAIATIIVTVPVRNARRTYVGASLRSKVVYIEETS